MKYVQFTYAYDISIPDYEVSFKEVWKSEGKWSMLGLTSIYCTLRFGGMDIHPPDAPQTKKERETPMALFAIWHQGVTLRIALWCGSLCSQYSIDALSVQWEVQL